MNTTPLNASTLGTTIIIILTIAMCIGWGKSIYKLTECDFQPPYKCEILYGIGILVPPIGAFIGWRDISDGTK